VNSVVELVAASTDGGPSATPNTQRWAVRREAAVVAAVRSGTITIEEALRRYQLTEEEFLSWQHAFKAHGLAGLRATRIQHTVARVGHAHSAVPWLVSATRPQVAALWSSWV